MKQSLHKRRVPANQLRTSLDHTKPNADPTPSTRNLWEKAGSSLEASSLDTSVWGSWSNQFARKKKKSMSCLVFRPGILDVSHYDSIHLHPELHSLHKRLVLKSADPKTVVPWPFGWHAPHIPACQQALRQCQKQDPQWKSPAEEAYNQDSPLWSLNNFWNFDWCN